MSNNLVDLSNDLAAAVAGASTSLVAVHARRRIGSSGVVWRKGVILTTSEAIRSEDQIRVLFSDGRAVEAKLRGRDPATDLAVLEADTGSIAPSDFVEDSQLKVGQIALAVGRTVDTGPIASLGVISGVAGEWKAWRGGKLNPFVRLDVSVYPTSSGGAAVNAAGGIFGLVSTGLSRTSVLAVTRTTIYRVAEQLVDKGYVRRGFLGIALQPVQIPDDLKKSLNFDQASGIMILGIEPNGPAAGAGITIGDVLLTAGGQELTDPEVLAQVLDSSAIGQTVPFRLVRGGAVFTKEVKIGERPFKGR